MLNGFLRCPEGSPLQNVLLKRRRKLLSLGHSYVVSLNRRLAHEISRAGQGAWEVTVAAPRWFEGQDGLGPHRLTPAADEPSAIRPLQARLTRHPHLFFYGWRLRSLLREGWDLVHCWEEPYIVAGWQTAWWTPRSTPLVFRTAQSLSKSYPPPFNWIEQYAMRRAAGWICSGQTVAENLRSRPGYAERPMRLIPLGVDLQVFQPDRSAGEQVRRTLGWPVDGPPVIGYLGRFDPEKGLHLLMEVLDSLEVPWRALFIGAGQLEPALRAWSRRHGGRVGICTQVKHEAVPAYLNALDVLTAPSQTTPRWKEQFGRMLIEGFACGVPVVGSDSGEIPYVLQDAGVVVGENDRAGWSGVLTELLTNPGRRLELSRRGLEVVHTKYGWPSIARHYLEFFEQLLASQRG